MAIRARAKDEPKLESEGIIKRGAQDDGGEAEGHIKRFVRGRDDAPDQPGMKPEGGIKRYAQSDDNDAEGHAVKR